MSFDLEIPQASISLESHMDRLVLEASVISNVLDTFNQLFPALQDKFGQLVSALKPLDDQQKLLSNLKDNVEESMDALQKLQVVKHSSTLVPIPEGFKGQYAPYIDFLADTLPGVYLEAMELISTYRAIISAFISNKESKNALSDQTTLFKKAAAKRQEILVKLGSFFDGTTTGRRPLSKLYENGRALTDTHVLVQKLGAVRKNHDLQKLHEQTQEIAELMDIAIKQTQKAQAKDTEVSGAAALNLAEGGLEVARWVELNATLYYRVEQAINVYAAQIEFIKKLH